MKLQIEKDSSNQIMHIFIPDSSSTTGAGLTGLAYNSAGLTAYYIRPGNSSATSIILSNATLGTFTSGGFKEVDATNLPGLYEIHLPNAVFATGADQVVVMYKGATNMAPVLIEIQIVGFDVNLSWPSQIWSYASRSLTDGVDVFSISGDSVAADNAELFFDNTGFTASNSTIGTVTSVTNTVNLSATTESQIDNIEADTNEIQGKLPAGTISDFDETANEVDLGSVKGTALTETDAGNLANNVSQFFDVNPTTTKDVDDVGTATVENFVFDGVIDANIVSVYGYNMSELIADNFMEFFDISGLSITLQDIEDIKTLEQTKVR